MSIYLLMMACRLDLYLSVSSFIFSWNSFFVLRWLVWFRVFLISISSQGKNILLVFHSTQMPLEFQKEIGSQSNTWTCKSLIIEMFQILLFCFVYLASGRFVLPYTILISLMFLKGVINWLFRATVHIFIILWNES